MSKGFTLIQGGLSLVRSFQWPGAHAQGIEKFDALADHFNFKTPEEPALSISADIPDFFADPALDKPFF